MNHQHTPTIDDRRCVHSLLPVASCSSCESACPREAIELDNDSLWLNDSLCDSCGLCVAACPVSAIELPRGRIALYDTRKGKTAYLACADSAGEAVECSVSCIHAVGVLDLTALHQAGVRMLVAHEPCKGCAVSPDYSLQTTSERFNRLMQSRGQATIELEILGSARWKVRAAPVLENIEKLDNYSRRHLFSRLLPTIDQSAERLFQLDSHYTLKASGTDVHAVHAYAPEIDASRCSGCDACYRLCPAGALTLINTAALHPCYKVDAGKCTGCGLCVDVCAHGAISLNTMTQVVNSEVELETVECSGCGVQHHQPKEYASQDGLCVVCRKRRPAADRIQYCD